MLLLKSSCVTAFLYTYSIGLSHDGDYNGCARDAPLGSIMSPTVYSRFDQYFWSNCTKTQIRQNIRYVIMILYSFLEFIFVLELIICSN